MFDDLRRHLAERKADHAYDQAMESWQPRHDAAAEALRDARDLEPVTSGIDLVLKKSEGVVLSIDGAALLDERATAGHWEGRSSGVSIPIGHVMGSSVRYHVSGSRGTYVPGDRVLAPVDTGVLWVTTERIVFVGQSQTRECAFAKLVATSFDTTLHAVRISVSNRQKPTIVAVGESALATLDQRLDLALAYFRDEVPALVARLQSALDAVDSGKPVDPTP